MIDEELKTRLDNWCDRASTTYSIISYTIVGSTTTIKRNDGNCVPATLHCFKTSYELKEFLDKSDKLIEKLNDSIEIFKDNYSKMIDFRR